MNTSRKIWQRIPRRSSSSASARAEERWASRAENAETETRSWPTWVPHPTAVLSATLLFLFAGVLGWGVSAVAGLADAARGVGPRVLVVTLTLAALSPIAVIAVGHHWFGGVLDRWLKTDRRGPRVGFFPGALSWWAGLYAWFVLGFSSCLSLAVAMVVAPGPSTTAVWQVAVRDITGSLSPFASVRALGTVPGAAWLVVAAYLFNLARVVEYRWRAHDAE